MTQTGEGLPTFNVRKDKNDISVQIRLVRMKNGFAVKTGDQPIFYQTAELAAEAIKQGILQIEW